MSDHPSDTTLQLHADGELASAERWEVERHVQACPACAREVDAYRQLLGRASELPRAIEPTVDLWPEIERRLGEAAPLSPRRGRGRRNVWSVLAAAAVLALGVALGRLLSRPVTGPELAAPLPVQSPSVLVTYDEAGYASAIADLEAVLREVGDRLQPETVATVEENLAIIDRAIDEARAALLADPANDQLHRQLATNMQMKIGLLRMITDAVTADL